MSKSVKIAVVIGISIVIGVVGYQFYETSYIVSSPEEYKKSIGTQSVSHVVYPDNPQMLGPLQINKDKYLLGENVYVILRNLMPMDNGEVLIFTPNGVLYDVWEFDGSKKDYMKKYFKPQLLMSKDLCEKEDLVGKWTIMFRGYEEQTLNFEMLGDILPNQEMHFKGCQIAYELDPTSNDLGISPDKPLPP